MKRISMALTSVLLFSSTLFAELSEKEVEVIAEQYADAILKVDYKAWQALSYDKNRVSEQDFFTNVVQFVVSYPRKIRITDVDDLNVKFHIRWSDAIYGGYSEGWLQLLPDGKIKYDPLICEHPIAVALKNWGISVRCSNTARCNSKTHQHSRNCVRKRRFERLKATGIPLFGYDLNASPFDQKAELRKISAWLKEEGAHWDNSEPKLDIPYKQYKEWMNRIRR